ncbi:unnamed protein product [Camellia sinensis]
MTELVLNQQGKETLVYWVLLYIERLNYDNCVMKLYGGVKWSIGRRTIRSKLVPFGLDHFMRAQLDSCC